MFRFLNISWKFLVILLAGDVFSMETRTKVGEFRGRPVYLSLSQKESREAVDAFIGGCCTFHEPVKKNRFRPLIQEIGATLEGRLLLWDLVQKGLKIEFCDISDEAIFNAAYAKLESEEAYSQFEKTLQAQAETHGVDETVIDRLLGREVQKKAEERLRFDTGAEDVKPAMRIDQIFAPIDGTRMLFFSFRTSETAFLTVEATTKTGGAFEDFSIKQRYKKKDCAAHLLHELKHASDDAEERLELAHSYFYHSEACRHLVTRHMKAFFEAQAEFDIIADAFRMDAEFTCMTGFYEFNRELYWTPVCEWGYSKRTGKSYRAAHDELDQNVILKIHNLINDKKEFITTQANSIKLLQQSPFFSTSVDFPFLQYFSTLADLYMLFDTCWKSYNRIAAQ